MTGGTNTGDIIKNKYKIIEILEITRNGNLYLVEDTTGHSEYILKEIKENIANKTIHDTIIKEFTTTVKNIGRIEKKINAPRIIDFFLHNNNSCLVIENNQKTINRLQSYPSLGRTLEERYMLIKGIASGGFGTVYLVKDATLKDKYWALKEMHEKEEHSAVIEKSFRKEANLLAKLAHPNIPAITHFFTDNEKHYLVMEYITGETLKEKIQKLTADEYFPEEQIVEWGITLCEVLHYLHNLPEPVIFRDLKPDNIIISDKGELKLIDFGIARVFEGVKNKTASHALLTQGYAPPEQWMGKATARSDIYSFGATLYYLLTKIHPREEAPNFTPPKKLNPCVSEKLNDIIMRCLQMAMTQRYETVKELKEELEKVKSQKVVEKIVEKALDYENNKEYTEASFQYKKILEIFPDDEKILFSLAKCYEKVGLLNEAEKSLNKIKENTVDSNWKEKAEEMLASFSDDDETTFEKTKFISTSHLTGSIEPAPSIDPEKSKVCLKEDCIISTEDEEGADINIILLDRDENPITGISVILQSDRSNDKDRFNNPLPTDKEGKTTGKIYSSSPGKASVTVIADGMELSDKPEVHFVLEETQFYPIEKREEIKEPEKEKIKEPEKEEPSPLSFRKYIITAILAIFITGIFIGGYFINNNYQKKAGEEKLSGYIKNGDKYFSQKNYEAALEEYKNALKINPDIFEVKKKLAEIYFIKKDFEKALIEYQRILSKEPENVEMLLKTSYIFNEKKEYERAIETIEKIRKTEPENQEALKLLKSIYLSQENYDKAFELIVKYSGEEDGGIETASIIGEKYREEKNYKKAEECFNFVLKKDSSNTEALKKLSNIYEETKKYEKIIEINKKIIEILPEDGEAFSNIGKSYYELKDYISANKWFKKALKKEMVKEKKEYLVSMIYDTYLKQGEGHLSKNEYKKAIEAFKSADALITGQKKVKEGLSEGYLGLSNKFIEEENYKEAEDLCYKVLDLFSEGPYSERANKYLTEIDKLTAPIYVEPVTPIQPYIPEPPPDTGPDVM